MPASPRRKANITISDSALRSWSRSGMRLKDIQRKIYDTTGWRPDISTISKWLKDMGEEPRRKSRRELIPWDVDPEHYKSRFRIMLQATERREEGLELSETDQKAVDLLDDIRTGRGTQLVIGYHPEVGFYMADATPEEIKEGAIIRKPVETKPPSAESLDLTADDETLAVRALAAGITPEQLENVGRNSAADILRGQANVNTKKPDTKANGSAVSASRRTRRRAG